MKPSLLNFNSEFCANLFVSYKSVSSFSGFEYAFGQLLRCFLGSQVSVLAAQICDKLSEFLRMEGSMALEADGHGFNLRSRHLSK